MKKTHRKIAEAFAAGRKATVHNANTDGSTVWLHNNRIVWRDNGRVFVTLCGWNTVTTRAYLNAILRIVGNPATFYTRKYEPYAGVTWHNEDGSVSSKWEIEVTARGVYILTDPSQWQLNVAAPLAQAVKCDNCDGTGVVTSYDSVPYGMGSTLMPSSGYCPDCLMSEVAGNTGKCPNCGNPVKWNEQGEYFEVCPVCGATDPFKKGEGK